MIRNLLLACAIFLNFNAFSQATRYVSPEGTGNGSTAIEAADFLSSTFWTSIQNLLQTQSVIVKFAAGDYVRAYTEKSLTLNGMGNAKNKLILEGESEQTIFSAPTGYDTKSIMVWLYNSQNITVKNFYFTGNGGINYVFRVTSGSGKTSKNILIENCQWEDMRGIIYGAAGTGQYTTSYVTFKNCTFKRIGLNSGSHMIYNAYDSHHISVIDSHFEDCTGDYVRFRDNLDYAVVKGTTFVRNPDFPNYPFIAMPLFNDVNPGDEVFATNYSFTDNTFTNANPAIQFYSSGYDPLGRNHLLTTQEGAILTGGTDQQKKDLLLNNFKINTDLIRIHNNTYNTVARQVIIKSINAYGSVSKGWTGEATISGLFNSSNQLLSWEEDYQNLQSGVWDNEERTLSYSFGSGEENKIFTGQPPMTVGGSSVSTQATHGFLPYIPTVDGGGSARVGYPSSNATFTLQYGDQEESTLKISASGSGNPAKFSLYNIGNASPVTSLFFTISFKDSTYTQVEWTCSMGNHTGTNNIFSNASTLAASTSTSNPEVFNAFRWRVARTNPNVIDFQYRNKPAVAGNASYTTANSTSFYRGGEFAIEIYANNHSSLQSYTRGGVIYELSSRTYHVWSNGERILKETDNYEFPANQLALGTNINSFMIHGTNSSSTLHPETVVQDNSAELVVANIKMNFAGLEALPVTLTSFNAKKELEHVVLNWATSSEINNSHFEILRSQDDKDFKIIGNIKGAGNSNSINNYSFIDRNPFPGTTFYQLRQVDYDGISQFSEIKSVNIGFIEPNALKVLAISNVAQLHFSYLSQNFGESILRVLDLKGQKHLERKIQLKKGDNYFSVDSNLPPGVYVALLKENNQISVIKFIR